MSDGATGGLSRDGWTILEDDGFLGLVGPFWHRIVDGRHEYAIEGQAKHRNRRGVVQGGLTMTLADRSCGMTARYETVRWRTVGLITGDETYTQHRIGLSADLLPTDSVQVQIDAEWVVGDDTEGLFLGTWIQHRW